MNYHDFDSSPLDGDNFKMDVARHFKIQKLKLKYIKNRCTAKIKQL